MQWHQGHQPHALAGHTCHESCAFTTELDLLPEDVTRLEQIRQAHGKRSGEFVCCLRKRVKSGLTLVGSVLGTHHIRHMHWLGPSLSPEAAPRRLSRPKVRIILATEITFRIFVMKHRPLEPVFLQRRGRISKDDSATLELHAQEQKAVRRKTVPEGRRSSFVPVWGNGWLIFAGWLR